MFICCGVLCLGQPLHLLPAEWRRKAEKKSTMHSIPIKGGAGEGPLGVELPLSVSAAPWLALGLEGLQPPRCESTRTCDGSTSNEASSITGPEPRMEQRSLTPPFFYLGWLTNAASYSKPKIQRWGSRRTSYHWNKSYVKCNELHRFPRCSLSSLTFCPLQSKCVYLGGDFLVLNDLSPLNLSFKHQLFVVPSVH